ncbi:MAG: NFACT RNA binding domain-containing protein [Bacteroidetes bacterium]|nr:NFACT RNA binding domain-containing protein [Bacteroidota bacterium]
MLTNYYTLRALIDEWAPRLSHSRVVDSYSQHKGSLIVVFETPEAQKWSLNASVQAPNRHLFMYAGVNRSRKNVVDVFPILRNQEVSGLEVAGRDRLVSIRFFSGDVLHLAIYGPTANVFLVEAASKRVSSFRGSALTIPKLRPAPPEPSEFEIEAHLRSGQPLKSLLPLFPATLINELWIRAGGAEDPRRISGAISEIINELNRPQALVYWSNDRMPLFSTINLHSIAADFQTGSSEGTIEKFDSVDEAVCVCARRRLAITRFSTRYDPLLKVIQARSETARNRLGRVIAELNKPSRSETHENLGHLLMAQPHMYQPGSKVAVVSDLISGGVDVEISMDPLLSAIENATQYYEKAKAARAARAVSKDRLQALQKTATELEKLLDGALNLKSEEDVTAFETQHSSWLKTLRSGNDFEESIPYRRFVLEEGYEVWVGRNAKQNDQLTLHDARKYDLWLHARGVAGSHTVLRLRGREDKPPHRIVEQAAAIAAWFSKARPSALVPVIVVERKYVRKPRKSLPGTVVVEREKVILVAPKLPE